MASEITTHMLNIIDSLILYFKFIKFGALVIGGFPVGNNISCTNIFTFLRFIFKLFKINKTYNYIRNY